MSQGSDTSLRKAVDDLSQVLNSSLGANQDCMQAIADIHEMLNSIETKLNRVNGNGNGETISFVPDTLASTVASKV